MVNNTRLGFDAFHGDKDHGGVHDGTAVVLWEWCKGENQSWKILPWGPEADSPAAGPGNASIGGVPVHTVRIFCKAGEDYCLTARNGTACLAPTNPRDEYQHWIKDMRHSNRVRDEEGYPAFALVNRVTGEAIKHSQGEGHQVSSRPSINLVSCCASSLDLIAFERRDQEVIFFWLRLSTDGWIVLQRGTHR